MDPLTGLALAGVVINGAKMTMWIVKLFKGNDQNTPQRSNTAPPQDTSKGAWVPAVGNDGQAVKNPFTGKAVMMFIPPIPPQTVAVEKRKWFQRKAKQASQQPYQQISMQPMQGEDDGTLVYNPTTKQWMPLPPNATIVEEPAMQQGRPMPLRTQSIPVQPMMMPQPFTNDPIQQSMYQGEANEQHKRHMLSMHAKQHQHAAAASQMQQPGVNGAFNNNPTYLANGMVAEPTSMSMYAQPAPPNFGHVGVGMQTNGFEPGYAPVPTYGGSNMMRQDTGVSMAEGMLSTTPGAGPPGSMMPQQAHASMTPGSGHGGHNGVGYRVNQNIVAQLRPHFADFQQRWAAPQPQPAASDYQGRQKRSQAGLLGFMRHGDFRGRQTQPSQMASAMG